MRSCCVRVEFAIRSSVRNTSAVLLSTYVEASETATAGDAALERWIARRRSEAEAKSAAGTMTATRIDRNAVSNATATPTAATPTAATPIDATSASVRAAATETNAAGRVHQALVPRLGTRSAALAAAPGRPRPRSKNRWRSSDEPRRSSAPSGWPSRRRPRRRTGTARRTLRRWKRSATRSRRSHQGTLSGRVQEEAPHPPPQRAQVRLRVGRRRGHSRRLQPDYTFYMARCHIEGAKSVTRRASMRSYGSSVEGLMDRRTSRMEVTMSPGSFSKT